jgi:hypothetical protein
MVRSDEGNVHSPQNLERNYRNYISDLEAVFDIAVLLKKKSIQFRVFQCADSIQFF